jgi:hypothetical protein
MMYLRDGTRVVRFRLPVLPASYPQGTVAKTS